MSSAAWVETLKRKAAMQRLFDCGGPGSGVPGPCPGEKGGGGGDKEKGKEKSSAGKETKKSDVKVKAAPDKAAKANDKVNAAKGNLDKLKEGLKAAKADTRAVKEEARNDALKPRGASKSDLAAMEAGERLRDHESRIVAEAKDRASRGEAPLPEHSPEAISEKVTELLGRNSVHKVAGVLGIRQRFPSAAIARSKIEDKIQRRVETIYKAGK